MIPNRFSDYKRCSSKCFRTGMIVVLLLCTLLPGCKKPETTEEKVYKIGIVCGFDVAATIIDGFKARMTELGYFENKNIIYDVQNVHVFPREEDRRVIERFVENDVDLILSFPTEASLWTKAMVREANIPVVFALAGMEGTNLVESVEKPGGNITGVRYPGPDLAVKRLELLREMMPQARCCWTAFDIEYPTNAASITLLRKAAAVANITLLEAVVTSPQEIQSDLNARMESGEADKIDAILMMPDGVTHSPAGQAILDKFALDYHIPIIGSANLNHEQNVLYYNADFYESGRLAANLADKILGGVPAGTIMVATPPSILRLNYRKAKELGLNISEGLLSRADEIIR